MDLERRGIPGGFVASAGPLKQQGPGGIARFRPLKVFVAHPIQDRNDGDAATRRTLGKDPCYIQEA